MLLSEVSSRSGVTVVPGQGSWNELTFCFLLVSRYNIQDKDTFFDNATRSRIVSRQGGGLGRDWGGVPSPFAWSCLAAGRGIQKLSIPRADNSLHSRLERGVSTQALLGITKSGNVDAGGGFWLIW